MTNPTKFVNALRDPRNPLGYHDGDLKQPIYAIERNRITTQAMVLCCQCMRVIRTSGGIIIDAWCVECTERKHAIGG